MVKNIAAKILSYDFIHQIIATLRTLSIRTKILFLGTGLIVMSFATYLPYILNAFFQDKKAYIYEAAMSESHDVQVSVSNLLAAKEKDLLSLSLRDQAYFQTEEFKKSTLSAHLLQYERYNFDASFSRTLSLVNEQTLRSHTLEKLNLDDLTRVPWQKFSAMVTRKKFIEYIKVDQVALVRVYLYHEPTHTLHFANYVADDIANQFSKPTSYSYALMSMAGNVIESSAKTLIPAPILEKLAQTDVSEGVVTQPIANKSYLIAFSKLPREQWIAISMIDEDEAYRVSYYILKKTLAFAGIIISLGVILGTLLARSLTTPIDDLVEGTRLIAQGNFTQTIIKRGEDELGQLAESFNFMSKELLRYIDEVKEKTRMENELAVAQLVQASFFPEKKVKTGDFSVVGHYAPASECGGDWWGTKNIHDKTLLFIGDATGHGVPAALITATANCCANLLPQICENHPEILNSPAKILEYFNLAVHKVGGKILMTFFIGIYDKKTKKLTYANASHNPPMLYRYREQEAEKADIQLLLDAEGERLGHVENPKFTEGSITMNDRDVLVMFSDGITESVNAENKPYGERRFIKSFLSHAKEEPEAVVNAIIADMQGFLGDTQPNDDVTLIIAKGDLA